MPEYDLSFSPFSADESGTYKLLELPPELATLIESAIQKAEPLNLNIKGDSTEDAVLCTHDRTYTVRSVNLSNLVLVISAPPDTHSSEFLDDTNAVVIRDQLNEILELAPTVPRIRKLMGLIRGREYGENQEEEEEDGSPDADVNRYTYGQARDDIQASDAELDRCLKERRILIVNDELRPISYTYLNSILELSLNILVSLSQPHTSASAEALTSALADDHGVSRVISTQVLGWFGEIQLGKWKMNVDEVIKELGLGLLRNHKNEPIPKDTFLSQWKNTVGDTFEKNISLGLLAGNYLEQRSAITEQESLAYFPASSLPMDPAARFSDLFLTRSRWKTDEITPFLVDIAIDSKERDKLLLKYCRAVTEAGRIWYTPRAQYNG